uniref:Carnosine dipeptidase 1 n=1 Tax=Haplochromis burtoni TaxID=8153 RepID=A0A3Q2W0I9_HAPBU
YIIVMLFILLLLFSSACFLFSFSSGDPGDRYMYFFSFFFFFCPFCWFLSFALLPPPLLSCFSFPLSFSPSFPQSKCKRFMYIINKYSDIVIFILLGNLYGRGASDNKAPVLAWIHAVEAYQTLSMDLPVNVKFVIEGMEETGSNGLDAMIMAQRDTFFSEVDYIIISDCGWLSRRPALTYGTRGNCYFFAEVEGPKQDLHSGVYGGTVIEPMTDLIGILDTLISPSGKILIPGIREAVAPLSDEEWKMYQDIQFDMDNYKNKIGVNQLMYSNKVDLLAHMWRYPTVSIHGIEGAFSDPGTKTVIPAKVTAKFSIRQVPDMDPAMVKKQVTDYLHSVFAKRKSPNKLKVTMVIGAKPWLADTHHPLYEAGKVAIKRVFNMDPDLIREGGTIPIARTFQDVTGKSIIMMPIGGFDDGLHSQNEKMSRYNYIEGTKLFIAYLNEVSQIKRTSV